jgi:hypothetical protein
MVKGRRSLASRRLWLVRRTDVVVEARTCPHCTSQNVVTVAIQVHLDSGATRVAAMPKAPIGSAGNPKSRRGQIGC